MENESKLLIFPFRKVSDFLDFTDRSVTIDWKGLLDNWEKGNILFSDVCTESKQYRKPPQQLFLEHSILNISSEIETLYSDLYQKKMLLSDDTLECISLCHVVFKLFDSLVALQNNPYYTEDGLTTLAHLYAADIFKRLAIIHEKRFEFSDAITICTMAVNRGVVKDGTEGGMIGRIKRLKKKLQPRA